jgi:hypothetical protein
MTYFTIFLGPAGDLQRSLAIEVIDDTLILDIAQISFIAEAILESDDPIKGMISYRGDIIDTTSFSISNVVVLDLGDTWIYLEKLPVVGWRYLCPECDSRCKILYKRASSLTCEHCNIVPPDHDYVWSKKRFQDELIYVDEHYVEPAYSPRDVAPR